jgi:hypothetical protein
MQASSREGEARTDLTIHEYLPHVKDWEQGDPSWKDGKGKGIIGSINYLASKGMNSVYFITLNIEGDGKDVWMYTSPDDFTRFDVSKLEQWEIVFRHMQEKGILLHFLTQETENECLLDGGDTGPLRTLYYRELISRFGHHNALIWNLGEENGQADWTPDAPAQTDAQRKAAARFFKENDPYQHPVVVHTLPNEEMRKEMLSELLGYPYLDGISLQQDKRELAPKYIEQWKARAKTTGHEWLMMMDEIGMYHTGALSDSADRNHPTLTRYALWGTLLSGASGVEWYFGGNSPHNDLKSEDWRQRDQLWEITHQAKVFFQDHLPYWKMLPNHHLPSADGAYCFCLKEEVYALYVPDYKRCTLNLKEASGTYNVFWFDPFSGGELQQGSVQTISGGKEQDLGFPPSRPGEDWVMLVERTD